MAERHSEELPALLNVRINDDIHVRDGVLEISGEPLTSLLIERQFPPGANGVAFAARHGILDQPRVLKVWLTNRAADDRDKLKQGLAEARAMAASHPDWAAAVYDASSTDGYFWAVMEHVQGETLKDYLDKPRSKKELWWLARLYINGIGAITTADAFHGDPHWNNVIVFDEHIDRHETAVRLKFIDFGTSKVGAGITRERHWRIVTTTFQKILRGFDTYNECEASIDAFHTELQDSGEYPAKLEYRNLILLARFDDILDGLKIEAGLW